jgi:uncharacterized protein YprB with RNaseH-like and TPR domain
MDLRQRLARLDQLTRREAVPEPARPGPAAVRGGAADDGALRRILAGELGLSCESTAQGPCWWRESAHPEVPPPPDAVPELDGILTAGTPAGLRWDEILFLDTETTGLAGGTGTLPFLVGLAWWRGDRLHVHQLVLPGPGREAPLLARLSELACSFRVVVTYNGASFDLPILRTRALLARTEDPCAHLVGWDLLVAARRIWGRRLPDCRQQTIERELTGRPRGPGDIDGALIPGVYAAFVRDRAAGLLPAVLRHNRRDMTGMARITVAVAEAARRHHRGAAGWEGPWQEAWSQALVGERRRDRAAAASWAACLVDAGAAAELDPPALLDAIRLLKRVADWPRVATLVECGLARWPQESRLHYEAAVLYEHRLRDPRRALIHAERLADSRRLARLRRRLGGS